MAKLTAAQRRAKEDVESTVEDAMRELVDDRFDTATQLLASASAIMGLLRRNGGRRVTVKGSVDLRERPDPRYSASLECGLKILRSFEERPIMGVAEVADKVGRSRSTTHRYLISLVQLGELEQTHGRLYKRVGAHVEDSPEDNG